MSFGFSGATDSNRYRFLSGFQLNDQGKNEDPTYLGFSIDFDFGGLGIDQEYGIPISPLFKDGNYLNKDLLETHPLTFLAKRNMGIPQVVFSFILLKHIWIIEKIGDLTGRGPKKEKDPIC